MEAADLSCNRMRGQKKPATLNTPSFATGILNFNSTASGNSSATRLTTRP